MPDEPAPKPPAQNRRAALPVITQNRMFTGLILIVTGFAVVSLLGVLALAIFGKDPPTTLQAKCADLFVHVCLLCVGALVGLLGGRAAAPDRLELGERK